MEGSAIFCEAGPGAVFNFQELLLERPPTCSLQAVTDVVTWTVPSEVFTRVAMRHTDVMLQLTQQISSQLQATQEAVQVGGLPLHPTAGWLRPLSASILPDRPRTQSP